MSHVSREPLQRAKRIVVKVGSRALVTPSGKPDRQQISNLVAQIVALRKQGREVVLVSSGAIAAGVEALGLSSRPNNLPDLQMAAAVGQSRLISLYDDRFSEFGLAVGQVLITRADLQDRSRHLNARNTFFRLLAANVVPIVNENDVVAVEGIAFGDNDLLASLVTLLVDADALILLSTVAGVFGPGASKQEVVPAITSLDESVFGWVNKKTEQFTVGGMKSKLSAAKTVVENGKVAAIASGYDENILERLLSGEEIGTFLSSSDTSEGLKSGARKKWIGFFHRTEGSIVLDAGAVTAVLQNGKSILPIGITAIEGTFNRGSMVEVLDENRGIIARGLSHYSSGEIERIRGKNSKQIPELIEGITYDEVIHRDNLHIVAS